MTIRFIKMLVFLITVSLLLSQDHWETAVYSNNNWFFLLPVTELPDNWNSVDFDDSAWLSGPGGFGYGDEDDGTVIDTTVSVYMRHTFDVVDPNQIVHAVLHVDYDDGFVAYLNGTEIGHSVNLGNPGQFVPFDATASTDHEAVLYQGGTPEAYFVVSSELESILTLGENVLAVQVHNVNITSSDMTSNVFLSFGIADSSTFYGPIPDWFEVPFTFTESNLPIVVIDTYGQEILDDPRIIAHMGIINNDTTINSISDPFNEYNGQISIEIRGSSSQMFPKKQYALETQDSDGENLNVPLLDMPSENDWVLYAPYSDKSLLRNYLAYNLAMDMGRYASRTRFCEVVINEDYKGLYVFMEKIKRDNNRVNISKLEPDETTGDDLTGGYIMKVDKWDGENNDGWWSDPPLPVYDGIWYQYHYPKPDEIVDEQRNYIINYFTDFENLMANESYTDPDSGYYEYINLGSFVDVSLMSELSKNVDAYRLSAYMYKDKDSEDGRLNVGPIWDYNLAFGNANYYEGWAPMGWQMEVELGEDPFKIPFWWYRIWDDETFENEFNQRWQNLRQSVFSENHIMSMIDSATTYIEDAQVRNFQRWPILDQYIWPNAYVGGTYNNEIDYLKDWITDRLIWIDEQAGLAIGSERVPESFTLYPNYPNPFNPSTTISFNIPLTMKNAVILDIYNINGKWISTLVNKKLSPGTHTIIWEPKNISSGVYFMQLKADGITINQKIIFIK